MKKKKYISLLFKIIGIIVFILIINKTDKQNLLNHIKNTNYKFLLLGFLLLMIYHFGKSFRWKLLLNFQKIKVLNFKDCYFMYIIGLYLGLITPGRIGDFIKVYYLKNRNINISKAFTNVLLDRILDVFFILYLSSILTFYMFAKYSLLLSIQLIILYIVLITLFLLFFLFFVLPKIIEFLMPKLPDKKIFILIKENYFKIKTYIKEISFVQWLILLLLTPFLWIMYFSVIYLFTISSVKNLLFMNALFAFMCSTLITFLPISFAGMGWRELFLVKYFPAIGFNVNDALIFSFAIYFGYIIVAVLGLIYSLFIGDKYLQKTK